MAYGRRGYRGRNYGRRSYRRRPMARNKRYRKRRTGKGFAKAPGLKRLDRMIVPDRALASLPYIEEIDVVFTEVNWNATQWHSFRSNNIFDPNLTGGGHQPAGHDQMGGFYRYYRVLGCKYLIKSRIQTDLTLDEGFDMAYDIIVWHSPTTTAGENVEDVMELAPYRHWKQGNIMSQRQGAATLKGKVVPAKVLGMTMSAYKSASNTWATFGASPDYNSYIHIGVVLKTAPPAGASNWAVNIEVMLVYDTVVSERRLLTIS